MKKYVVLKLDEYDTFCFLKYLSYQNFRLIVAI